MAELPNLTKKDYRITEFITMGGMGAVYRAEQLSLGRDVIVKVIRQEYAQDEAFIRNFKFEAQTIARLESAFIVPLIDYWSDETGSYMVMRYMRGGTLQKALERDGQWPLDRIETLLGQVAQALDYAHVRNIIHRDIKPANILLDDQGVAYLSDFGLASERRASDKAGERGYTPAYASPEQIQEKQGTDRPAAAADTQPPGGVGVLSDIYSLGVVLYEMLVGARPFNDPSVREIEARHLNEALPAVTTMRAGLPKALNEVIWRATAKTPTDRYPSPLALYRAFQEATGAGADTDPTREFQRVVPDMTVINPYKGLQPFEQYDRDNFFGRTRLVDRLVNRVRETRFLAVVGPSGSGKSSVVKAGLVPRLRQGVITNADRWYIEEMTPGANVLANLAEVLRGVLATPPPSLEEQLRLSRETLGNLVRDRLRGDDSNRELLLVVDQFEEVFTLNDEDEARHFMENIAWAVQDPDSRLRVLITIRADFYDRPLNVTGFGPLVSANVETVTPLEREELEAAIVGPVERIGVGLEPNLANQIIDDVIGQPGVLPLLQHALRDLYDDMSAAEGILTLRSYRAIGGVTGALGRRAETIYQNLDAEGRDLAKLLFLNMLTVKENMEATRRRVLRTGLPNTRKMTDVIDAFGNARLLTFDRDPETRVPSVDIAHEALIRSWDRLAGWAAENRDTLRALQQLSIETREWLEQGVNEAFLAPVGRLTQYEALVNLATVTLTDDQRTFIRQSREKIDRTFQELERMAEVEKRNAEIERENAARQARNARRLGVVAAVAGVLLLVAAALAFVAITQNETIAQGARDLETQVVIADGAVETSIADQAEAEAQAVTAAFAQAEAENQAAIAATNEANATIAQGEAEAGGTQVAQANETSVAQVTQVAAAQAAAETQAAIATIAQGAALEAAVTSDANAAVAATQAAIATLAEGEALVAANIAATAQAAAEVGGTEVAQANETSEAQIVVIQTAQADANEQAIRAEERANDAATQRAIAQAAEIDARNSLNAAETQAAIAAANEAAAISANATVEFQATSDAQRANEARSLNQAAQAELLLDAGEYQLAAALAVEANRNVDAPAEVQRVLSLAAYQGPRDILQAYNYSTVTTIARCGDDRDVYLTGDTGGIVTMWRITNGQLVEVDQLAWHTNAITAIACNADGTRAATGGDNGNIAIWNVGRSSATRLTELIIAEAEGDGDTGDLTPTPTPLTGDATPTPSPSATAAPREPALALAFYGRDNQYLVAGYGAVSAAGEGVFRLWGLGTTTPEVLTDILGHNDAVNNVVITADGTRMISTSAGNDGEIIQWNTEGLFTDDPQYEVERRVQNGVAVTSLAMSADEGQIVVGGTDGSLTVWSTEGMQQQERLTGGHTGAVTQVVYGVDADGIQNVEYILSASADRTLALWDTTTYRRLRQYRAHERPVNGLAFGLDDDRAYLVSTSEDSVMMLWDLKNGAEEGRVALPDVPLQQGLDVANDDFLVTYNNNQVFLWAFDEGVIAPFIGDTNDTHEASVLALALAPDGTFALSGDQDGEVILSLTGQGVREGAGRWQLHNAPVLALAVDPNGELAASGAADRTLLLWDADTGQVITDLPGHDDGVGAVTFCCTAPTDPALTVPRIASGSDGGQVYLWERQPDGAWTPTTLAGHPEGGVTDLAFSPDGTLLLSASTDNTIIAWDTDPGSPSYLAQLGIFRQHTGAVNSVDISPDGTLALSASDDGTIIVWNVRATPDDPVSGAPLNVLLGHTAAVNRARFLGGGGGAASSGDDGQIIIWRIDRRDELLTWTERNRYIPPLDPDDPENVDDTLRGQPVCEVRAAYNFDRQCADGRLPEVAFVPSPTPTPTATPTPTPSVSPTPTPTLTPTPSLTPDVALAPPGAIMPNLQLVSNAYYEAERRDLEILDQSFQRNNIRWRTLDGVYDNFVFHTEIDWGAGSLQDRCGFLVRLQDRENFYILQLDQLGNIYFTEQTDDVFRNASGGFIDVDPANTAALPLHNSTRDRARLVVVAEGNTLRVVVNNNPDENGTPWLGDTIKTFDISARREGYVALAATVLDSSREAGCIFRNTWVAPIGQGEPPPPTLPPPTLVPLAQPMAADVGVGEIVAEVLRLVPDAQAEGGYIAEQTPRVINDISDRNNLFTWLWLDPENRQTYTNFVMGARLTLDTDSPDDACGFVVRSFNGDNFYAVLMRRDGRLSFEEQEAGEWLDGQRLDGSGIRPGVTDVNELIVLGLDVTPDDTALPESRFIVFVNGQYAGEVLDGSNTSGYVGLAAETNDESDITRCNFERAWVWNLDTGAPPAAPPPPTPVPQPARLEVNAPTTATLPAGGRHIWTYIPVTGEQVLDVSVTAARPANNADAEARRSRRLLDVELRVTACDGGFIAYGGDIVFGQATDVRLRVTLGEAATAYCFEVYSFEDRDAGEYTILLEPVTTGGE